MEDAFTYYLLLFDSWAHHMITFMMRMYRMHLRDSEIDADMEKCHVAPFQCLSRMLIWYTNVASTQWRERCVSISHHTFRRDVGKTDEENVNAFAHVWRISIRVCGQIRCIASIRMAFAALLTDWNMIFSCEKWWNCHIRTIVSHFVIRLDRIAYSANFVRTRAAITSCSETWKSILRRWRRIWHFFA